MGDKNHTLKLSPLELQHMVWEKHEKRIAIHTKPEQIQELLPYKVDEIPENQFNHMRDEIMLYIERHKNMLSLPCDGNCYGHTDGVVVFCHQQLLEDQSNDRDKN